MAAGTVPVGAGTPDGVGMQAGAGAPDGAGTTGTTLMEAGHPIMAAIITTATSVTTAAGVQLIMPEDVTLTTTTAGITTAEGHQIIMQAEEVSATTTAAGITAVQR